MERPLRWRVVLDLLRSCYAELLPLEAFVRRLQVGARAEGGEVQPLVQTGDPKCYRSLVEQCVVGLPVGGKPLPPRFTFQQVSSQVDVVARVVQRICEKKKKNILAFGYALLDENNHRLPCLPNICSYLPNNTSEMVRHNVVWEIVLGRVGDDVMMYILEHCGLFMLVPPSCCYQICGQPIYELAARDARPSSRFVKQKYSRRAHSVLSSYLRRRFQSCTKQYQAKAYRGMWNFRKQRWNKVQEGLDCNSLRSSVVQRTTAENPTKNKPVIRTGDYLASQQEPSHCPSIAAALHKRKWQSQCETSAKRMKTVQTEAELEKKARNPICPKSKNQLILDAADGNTSERCARSCSVEKLTPTISLYQRSDCGPQISDKPHTALDDDCEFVACGKTLKPDRESRTLGESSTNPKINTWVPELETALSGTSSVQMIAAKNMTAERGLKTHSSNPVLGSSDKISAPATHIERHSLLYCQRQLKECLPQSFVLNHLKGYRAGGRRLVEVIFLGSKIVKQPGNPDPPSCKWRKKRLPKRYWQMRGVFQELLRNHSKCPYVAVLKKNCPVWVSKADKTDAGQGCQQTDRQERGSLSRAQQVNTTEDSLERRPGGVGPFQEMPGVLSRISEKSELTQEQIKQQASRLSSRSSIMVSLKQHSSHWQVYAFVRECLERVIPAALWGSCHNKCRFYKNVKKFISLGKFASFSLQELMWKMRVSDCTWLRLTTEGRFIPAPEHRFRERLFSTFLYWLMDSYVAELLRSFFYITETMFQKNLLFFFRKTVWSKLQRHGIRSHLAKVQLRALSKKEIEALQQKKCVPLASKLRFIPKRNGLRPVVKLNSVVGAEKFCSKSRDKKVQYFNTQLKNLFSVLNYERMKNPTLLGSSVFGKDEIHVVWKKFVLKVLEANAKMPQFYFVKADVTGAYDTIPHNKLVEVISQVLDLDRKTSYSIRRYAVVMKTRNGFIRRFFRRHVSACKEFIPDLKHFVGHLQKSSSLRNAVIVEQDYVVWVIPSFPGLGERETSLRWYNINSFKGGDFCEGKDLQIAPREKHRLSVSLKEKYSRLREFFLQLIHNSILKIENRYHVQCCGIPQGSILSTLLCNFCYGDMENKLLHGVPQDGVLMRLTDDFLLVTPHLTQAMAFLRTLATGIPEYGFEINPAKTVVNFPVDEAIPGCSEFKQLPSCCVIPWCGLLIDTQTLEVSCDYSSYACTSIRSSLSFNSSNNAGVSMRNKLLAVLQLKCHGLFLDLQINSLRTVCINLCKILLLQAYSCCAKSDMTVKEMAKHLLEKQGMNIQRFHACVLQLPFNQQIKNNPSFFLRVISDTAACCFSVLKVKNAEIYFSSPALTYEATQWLCYHAFSIKLANHRVIYKCLLIPLQKCKIQLLHKIPKATMQLLKEVTEPSIYEDFKAILD